MNKIFYKEGYKYQLANSFFLSTNIYPSQSISTYYIDLATSGDLTIRKGYAWDGASGPAVDTANFMRGSVVHDALYQLMRSGDLDREQHRLPVDQLLRTLCREDGMSWIRSSLIYQAVRLFGEKEAHKSSLKETRSAPLDES